MAEEVQHLVYECQVMNFSSANATNYLNGTAKSHVKLQFSPPIKTSGEDIHVCYFTTLHAEIPSSQYIVPASKTTISINGTPYSIQAGNLGVNTMITALASVLPASYALTYSSTTNRFTLTNTLADFTVNATQTTMARYLGMGSDNLTSTLKSLTFPYPPNFLPTMRYSFYSPSLGIDGTGSEGQGSMFLSVQNNSVQLATAMYVNYTNTRFVLKKDVLTDFEILITNDDGSFCDFQNVDWNLTVKIEFEIWR